ncbi:MAG: Asp-tRNA(Asn)/Glu-tRNA(Gln) amidotransferase subunit GatB [Clostridiales bacterium]|nr:Asp-tRNA(Asn)/Glu-tRNA(Gln) amidotransferase subunit GatB [Clostridiales bacterium]
MSSKVSNNDYEIVVGLEVHAELNTVTKAYCSCKNSFGLEVNSQICPICTALPGALPTLNEKVVEYAIKMGHALNCKINNVTKQDRKNYFYPDLPKAYQISQFDIPLCEHGYLDVLLDDGEEKRIGVTRIHIEEDAGKLLHDEAFSGSLVDFNRSSVPLIEIVSEPDIRSSKEAKAYLETIKSILKYLNISDAKMQEGSIRCDVNVSVRKKRQKEFGTRCEMKNVNSFSAAMRAIDYEANRQIEVIENGGVINQETRRWDDVKGISIAMRSKEDAQDYRYFPEPDLGTIVVDKTFIQKLKDEIPELPHIKQKRYIKELGIPQVDAALLVENLDKSRLFDECMDIGGCSAKNVSNWILGDVSKVMNDLNKSIYDTNVTAEKLVEIITLIEKGEISTSAGKTVFEEILSSDKAVSQIVDEKGLKQISDSGVIEQIVKDVLSENEKSINDYKNGKTNALGFLVGQCMKRSKGKANPALAKELILKYIEQ